MFEKMSESSKNILGYKAIGTISASDYEVLDSEVKALIHLEGKIRMLLDMTEFKWEKVEAWLPDLKFGHEFHHQIEKMAIVGDKSWEKWITHLAKYAYASEAKFFHSADISKAWTWLRE
jgi:SpoIIAA-like